MSASLGCQDYPIICVGNRYAPADNIGPRVYDALLSRPLPDHARVLDGGLLGLNLLKFVEGVRQAIFVDTLHGFGQPDELIVIPDPLSALDGQPCYGHQEGLLYLLKMLPLLFPRTVPGITLLGAEAYAGDPTIDAIAAHCISLISQVNW